MSKAKDTLVDINSTKLEYYAQLRKRWKHKYVRIDVKKDDDNVIFKAIPYKNFSVYRTLDEISELHSKICSLVKDEDAIAPVPPLKKVNLKILKNLFELALSHRVMESMEGKEMIHAFLSHRYVDLVMAYEEKNTQTNEIPTVGKGGFIRSEWDDEKFISVDMYDRQEGEMLLRVNANCIPGENQQLFMLSRKLDDFEEYRTALLGFLGKPEMGIEDFRGEKKPNSKEEHEKLRIEVLSMLLYSFGVPDIMNQGFFQAFFKQNIEDFEFTRTRRSYVIISKVFYDMEKFKEMAMKCWNSHDTSQLKVLPCRDIRLVGIEYYPISFFSEQDAESRMIFRTVPEFSMAYTAFVKFLLDINTKYALGPDEAFKVQLEYEKINEDFIKEWLTKMHLFPQFQYHESLLTFKSKRAVDDLPFIWFDILGEYYKLNG